MEAELDAKLKLKVLLSTAVTKAISEMISENRAELLQRAKAKLTAMGVEVTEDELNAQLS